MSSRTDYEWDNEEEETLTRFRKISAAERAEIIIREHCKVMFKETEHGSDFEEWIRSNLSVAIETDAFEEYFMKFIEGHLEGSET